MNSIIKYKTKFKYIGDRHVMSVIGDKWAITEFVTDLENDLEFKFVMQPVSIINEVEAFSGLHAYVVSQKQLEENFKIIPK
jgi:hypothetical protein